MSDTNNIEHYRNQISLARTEIKNLRQQITSLKHEHQKEVQLIKSNLEALRCANCVETATTCVASNSAQASTSFGADEGCINFKPIGVIETTFQNKRGVPRQPTGLNNMPGTIVIDPGVFNNPEHALSGLEEFSHMWILFHFHETNSQRVQAKVSPPRLLGERRGVFTTRSPHRPCPIGLSLVKIQSCEGNKIHFTGVDMINGTPVLDVKPYIVQYDYPAHAYHEYMQDRPPTEGFSQAITGIDNLTLRDGAGDAEVGRANDTNSDGVETTLRPHYAAMQSTPESPTPESPLVYRSPMRRLDHERGAPDGQERFTPPQSASITTHDHIREAPWIQNAPSLRYVVQFTEDALESLNALSNNADAVKTDIESLLTEDPRSNYVRERYPEHECHYLYENLSITSVFHEDSLTCTVLGVCLDGDQ